MYISTYTTATESEEQLAEVKMSCTVLEIVFLSQHSVVVVIIRALKT